MLVKLPSSHFSLSTGWGRVGRTGLLSYSWLLCLSASLPPPAPSPFTFTPPLNGLSLGSPRFFVATPLEVPCSSSPCTGVSCRKASPSVPFLSGHQQRLRLPYPETPSNSPPAAAQESVSVSLSFQLLTWLKAPPPRGLSQPGDSPGGRRVFTFPTSAWIARLSRLKASPWSSGRNYTAHSAGSSETRTEQQAETQKRRLRSETPNKAE